MSHPPLPLIPSSPGNVHTVQYQCTVLLYVIWYDQDYHNSYLNSWSTLCVHACVLCGISFIFYIMYVHQYISLWCVVVFQCSLTISSLLLLLNLPIFVCIAMFYDVSPILFAGLEERRKRKFPTTPTVHRCTGYVFVCVCRCVHTSVHVTKPPLTQSMSPFFLIYVLYSVLMYLYSLDSLYTPCVCMCMYAH